MERNILEFVHCFPGGYAIVSYKRKCNDEDLAPVRRVSHRFWVSDHSCLEDQFSSNALRGTEAVTLVHDAILEFECDKALVGAAAQPS